MRQPLLELGSIPEPRSSSPHLHAIGRKRMDPDTHAYLLTVALLHRPPPTGAGPQTGGGTHITWKCIGADEDIPLMPQPNMDSAIASSICNITVRSMMTISKEIVIPNINLHIPQLRHHHSKPP